MTAYDLYQRYGFDKSDLHEGLLSLYVQIIRESNIKIFSDVDIIDPDEVVKDACDRLSQLSPTAYLAPLVWFCYRKKISSLLKNNTSLYVKNHLVKEYQKELLNADEDLFIGDELDRILSFFRRKDFQYFCNRYYFFKEEVEYDARIEKRIGKLFMGKGDIQPLYLWTKMHKHSTEQGAYMRYLDSISMHFIGQIDGTGPIIPHKSTDRYKFRQWRFNVRRISLPIIFIISIIFLIVLFIYVHTE